MPQPGIELTSIQFHPFWETWIQDAFPTELPRPHRLFETLGLTQLHQEFQPAVLVYETQFVTCF